MAGGVSPADKDPGVLVKNEVAKVSTVALDLVLHVLGRLRGCRLPRVRHHQPG